MQKYSKKGVFFKKALSFWSCVSCGPDENSQTLLHSMRHQTASMCFRSKLRKILNQPCCCWHTHFQHLSTTSWRCFFSKTSKIQDLCVIPSSNFKISHDWLQIFIHIKDTRWVGETWEETSPLGLSHELRGWNLCSWSSGSGWNLPLPSWEREESGMIPPDEHSAGAWSFDELWWVCDLLDVPMLLDSLK